MKIHIEKELKPCPFCGGKAEMHFYGSHGRIIKCTDCLVNKKQKVLRNTVEWLEEKMIEDWNKRTNNV